MAGQPELVAGDLADTTMAGQPELVVSRPKDASVMNRARLITKDFSSATKEKQKKQLPKRTTIEKQPEPAVRMKVRGGLGEPCKPNDNAQGKIAKDQGVVKLRESPAYNRQMFSDLVHKATKRGNQ